MTAHSQTTRVMVDDVASSEAAPPLRVGLLVRSHACAAPAGDRAPSAEGPGPPRSSAKVTAPLRLPAWFAEALGETGDAAELVAVFVLPGERGMSSTRPSSWLLRAALSVDRRRVWTGDDPSRTVDAPRPSHGIADILDVEGWLCGDGVSADAIDVFVAACDVPEPLLARLSMAASLGVCEILTESRNAAAHPCPGAASLALGAPTLRTDAVLRRGQRHRLLCRREMRLHPSSIAMNVERTLNPARDLLRTALTKLARNRHSIAHSFPPCEAPMPPPAFGLGGSVRLVAGIAQRTFRNRFAPPSREQWGIGMLQGHRLRLGEDNATDVHWADIKPDAFLADPFPIEVDGTLHVFVEEFPYSARKGHISVLTLGQDGSLSQPVKVVEEDVHLSFPFVFRQNGRFYMIPERAEGRSIALYEAIRFPYEWRESRVLVPDFAGIDTTLYRRGNTVWLLSSSAAHGNHDNNLHLFSADSLLGEFRPHARNPVKTGIESSRNAGRLFTMGGDLYRPAQNCRHRYGGSIIVNRVTRLDEDDYVEEPYCEIMPFADSGFPLGLHTINHAGNWTVIDGLRTAPGV